MALDKFYNGVFKPIVDKSEKKEELEFMIKEILTYLHNYSRAIGSICVSTIEFRKIINYDWNETMIDLNKFKSDTEFYETIKNYYEKIEKRKEQHLKDGFDWNNDPFKDWTKEDWENY